MNVSLTPELESFVTTKLGSGLYGSQSEVVREGLRLLMERDRMVEARLQDLRTEVAQGLDQAPRRRLGSPTQPHAVRGGGWVTRLSGSRSPGPGAPPRK
jgi:antitoxin ParD1/3/4